jgi:hypothetical protein
MTRSIGSAASPRFYGRRTPTHRSARQTANPRFVILSEAKDANPRVLSPNSPFSLRPLSYTPYFLTSLPSLQP